MKKKLPKVIWITVIIAIVLSILTSVLAVSQNLKDENVYVLLNEDGSINEVYIVNAYQNYMGKRFEDYGNYESVENLSTKDKLDNSNGHITATIPKGKFYYKGKSKELQIPWNISIAYTLDGKKIWAKDLAGKSGTVEISITVSQNKNLNPIFFENYSLQISTMLNADKFSNIVAEKATIANIGENKSISYMLLPKKEGNFKIYTVAKNFEMDAITISGIPLNMNVELNELSDLTKGISEVKDGIATIDTGAKTLRSGSEYYKDGINKLASQSDSIINGSKEVLKVITELSAGVDAMGLSAPQELQLALSKLKDQYEEMNTGISQYAKGVKKSAAGYSSINDVSFEIAKGTSNLRTKTSNLEGDINHKVESALKGFTNEDFKPLSFASSKNVNIAAVQFIIKTKGIEIIKKPVVADEVSPKLSLWNKIINLIKK